MFSSSEVYLIQGLGGIQPHPDAKGFDRVLIKPKPPKVGLDFTNTSVATIRGVIATAWHVSNITNLFTLTVIIPPGIVATIYMPLNNGSVWEEGTLRCLYNLIFIRVLVCNFVKYFFELP